MQSGLKNSDFLDYKSLSNSDEILIRFGIDKDKNGNYEYHEPAILMKYSLLNRKLEQFISDETKQNLQDLLDGQELN